MPNKHYPVKMGIIFAGFLLVLSPRIVRAQNPGSVALTGQVTSQAEGPMEGVLVSAKGAGSNITVTVVSNDTGNYSFSGSQLKPGKYAVNIRAVGYEISSPKGEPAAQPPQLAPDKHTAPLLVSVDIAPNKTTKLDLKLAKSADLASQLTKAEWLMSFPGTDEQKTRVGGNGCAFCHSLERVVKSKYDAAALLKVVQRMGDYSDGSTPFNIVKIPKNPDDSGPREPDAPDVPKQIADYLATVNLSTTDHWKYELKTLPRPKGQATKVVYTEYDLPRRATSPHDAVMGPDGMVWYTDFGSLTIGRLDPRTGEVKEFTLPIVKPTAPRSGLLSMSFDKDGNPWAGSLREGAVYKFDKKTEKFSTWSAPGEYNNVQARTSMIAPQHSDVDGKVWFDNALRNKVLHRINLATNQVETVNVFPDKRGHSVYGIASDPMNNLIFTDYAGSGIGIIDAKTTKVTVYPTPTPNAWPRRGSLDSQGRFWFGENQANRLGMFDTKTKQFKEWEMPTPWTDPYDAMLDKNGDAWTAGMMADRVIRLNPITGKTIEYLLPRPTQTRRVFVDNSTTPVTFWVGSNLGGSIVRVQPVE